MNTVNLIGRLTKDPDVRYGGAENDIAVGRFSIAVDRPGKDKGADFPSIMCFGKTAELAEKYLSKGQKVGITGRIQTGSYINKDGQKVYTTDIICEKLHFIDWGDKEAGEDDTPVKGFSRIDEMEDLPF